MGEAALPDAVVDSTPVVDAAPVEFAAEQVEVVETHAEPVAEEPVATEEPPSEEEAEWNREVEGLEALPWWEAIPEDSRAGIRRGLKKFKADLQKPVTKRLQGFAKDREDIARERNKNSRERASISNLMFGGEDPAAPLQARIEELEAAAEVAANSGDTAREQALEALKVEHEKALEGLNGQVTSLTGQRDQARTALTAHEARQQEKLVTYIVEDLQNDAPEVYADDEAFEVYLHFFTGQGKSHEHALARAKMIAAHNKPAAPEPPKPRALSPAVAAATVGGNRAGRVGHAVPVDADAAIARMEADARRAERF